MQAPRGLARAQSAELDDQAQPAWCPPLGSPRPAPALPFLSCQHVSRFFGDTVVLRRLNFACERGYLLTLWGANGAGKSTLLRILAGALRPSSGTVILDGAAAGRAPARRQTGFLSHQSLLHPNLTVAENLRFYATLFGLPDGAAATAQALRQVRGGHLAPRRVSELSQGMRQKAALARCLLHQPALLLLDEPFASLDQPTVAEMRACLAELRDSGMLLVLTSHNPEQVAGLADGELTLIRGQLSTPAAGRPERASAPAGTADLRLPESLSTPQPPNATCAPRPPLPASAVRPPSGKWWPCQVAAAVAARDLRIELRTREALLAMGFYALLVIVIFSFAFNADAALTLRAGGGLLWIAFLFASLVALDRAFLRETGEASLTGLQISPASRSAIMAGKFLSSLAVILVLEIILVPLFAILFNAPAHAHWGGIALTTVLGTWALAANGTYFSAMSVHTRQRGLLLPLLLLPVSIPALLAMVEATGVFLSGVGVANYWLKLLVGYDVIFSCLGLLLADMVLDID
ncbi:MAG: heme exporter protein CcmB [Terriglobales bacterium]